MFHVEHLSSRRVSPAKIDPHCSTWNNLPLWKLRTNTLPKHWNRSRIQFFSTYKLLVGECDAASALQKTELENLLIIPAHKNLVGVNFELIDAENREFRLRDALAPMREKFSFIVLDCPPALDLLTLNSLVAA